MRELRSIQKWINEYHALATQLDDLEVLLSFYKSGEAEETEVTALHQQVEEAFESLEFRNMLSEEGDALSAVLQITAGAGGTESCVLGANACAHVPDVGRKKRLKNSRTQPPAGGCGRNKNSYSGAGRRVCIWVAEG